MLRPLFLALLLTSLGTAPRAQDPALIARYVASEHMVPMRDGVKLRTFVVAPRAMPEPLPIVMMRTPYDASRWQRHFGGLLQELAADGYVFAFQDLRGCHGSEGTFDMQRPLRATDPALAIDENTDANDTIEWLVHAVDRNNGRVGMLGISYDGWTTIMAAVDPHPALRAISPQASPADMWLGDDFHHNGAFRLSYGFEYAAMMEAPKDAPAFRFDGYDVFDWYLRLGSLKHVKERVLQLPLPSWDDYVAHPDYDAFWQAQTVIPNLGHCTVPTLNVAGWWDQEDFYGPLAIYAELEKHDDRGINFLVVGPWNHGGWQRDGDRLGAIPFGGRTGAWYREHVQAVWFRHWLKDKGELDLPEALTFEAGSNEWRRWPQWPPRGPAPRTLYLHADGALAFAAPTDADLVFDEFVSDPAHPVPYRHRPIQATYGPGSKWREWLVEDQRFVKDRPDVLTWQSAPLAEDLAIAGEITAHIYASTTGTDADWIVKLIDVYPDDYAAHKELTGHCLMVANEVFRGRYKNGFTRPEPLPAGEPVEFTFSLHTQDYCWKKGHRLMVQVQSTWFPLIDRNPQTFVTNIFQADDADFRVATHRVYRSAARASGIVLPVVGK